MKKLFVLLVVTLCSMRIFASTYAGYCGPKENPQSLTWFLNTETGVLTFRGSGEVLHKPNHDSWYSYVEYITSIVLPDQIKVIDDFSFTDCSRITTITLPSQLTTIGQSSFRGCTALQTIQLPNTVTTIKEGAFKKCESLTSIVIPNGVTTIERETFEKCTSLRSVVLSNKIKTIQSSAFANCTSLQTIKFPISCTEIGYSAFMNCRSLKNVRIPINCAKIGDDAFEKCSSLDETFFIPLSVRSIGVGAFQSTPIKKFYYPFGVSITNIGLDEQTVNFQVYMEIPDEFADFYENRNGGNNEDSNVYSVPEVLPVFPGGAQAMTRFLADNIHYPEVAADNGIQGKVVCSFIINKDGSVSDVEVVRSGGDPSLDKEAVRLIKSMPKWTPGTIKGKPVRVKLSAPVTFRIN